MKKQVWRDEMLIDVVLLARSGMTKQKIAKALGVSVTIFYKWLKRKSALRYALAKGRETSKGIENFRTYVYNRLPQKLKDIWDSINAIEKKRNGVERVEAILKDAGKKARQHLFLYAYTTCGFNASEACRAVVIDRQTYEAWYKKDPEFHALFDEMEFHKKNYFEGALVDLVQARETSAVIFANRTYNADRGYGAKVEVKHSGEINHNVNVVPIKDLDLDTDLKKALLQAIRDKKAAEEKQLSRINYNANDD